MAVPNLKPIIQRVRDSQAWDFRTKAGLCAYSHACVVALHREDPDFKHLKKRVPQNGCYPPGSNDGHAVDAALYVPTGQAMDFIGSAGFGDPPPENAVAWGTKDPVGKYDADDGYDPVDDGTDPPPDPPDDDVAGRLANLEREMMLVQQKQVHMEAEAIADRARMEAINDRLEAVDASAVKQPLPDYEGTGEGKVFGIRIPVTVTSHPKP